MAMFRVAPQRHRREIHIRLPTLNAVLLQKCHHLQWKEQLWLAERICQNGSLHRGDCHLQLKEQFSLAEPLAISEAPFASSLKLEMPRRRLRGRPWMQIGLKTTAELTRSRLWGKLWMQPRKHDSEKFVLVQESESIGATYRVYCNRLEFQRLNYTFWHVKVDNSSLVKGS